MRRASGFRERRVRELELRVALGSGEGGVCQVVVDELEDEIHVLVLIHCEGNGDGRFPSHHHTDCPVCVWLDTPLGERAVIDVDSNEKLPLYTPMYLNNEPQADHGYRPANRHHEGYDPRRLTDYATSASNICQTNGSEQAGIARIEAKDELQDPQYLRAIRHGPLLDGANRAHNPKVVGSIPLRSQKGPEIRTFLVYRVCLG